MRTTLNLDADVASPLRELARKEGRSLSRTVNAVLRDGLRARRRADPLPPYDPPTFDSGEPMVDVTDVAAALETLEDGD